MGLSSRNPKIRSVMISQKLAKMDGAVVTGPVDT
jgi:hypothetical protein